jgi:hypothetical protein
MAIEPHLGAEPHNRGHFRWGLCFIVICAIVLAVLGLKHWTSGGKPDSSAQQQLTLAEQAYAGHVHFGNIQMARAENFLNQEITYISGVISNDGPRRILVLDVTADFHDFSGKIILHETRHVFGARGAAMQAGQGRDFQLAFESVPDTWNQNYPDLKIAALTLE